MVKFLAFVGIALVGWAGVILAEDTLAVSGDISLTREPRTLKKKKLCRKFGICEGYGGHGGGYYGGHQGGYQGGYPEHPGGFQGGYPGYPGFIPAINIGISQSQSSASAGGGGYSQGYYPNNHQYNGYQPNHGGPGGYPGGSPGGYPGGYPGGHPGGYPGYPNQGFNRPGFGNGQGSYNNQFNGNYYGPGGPNGGGYGFHDEDPDKPIHEEDEHNGPDGDRDNYQGYNDNQGPPGPYNHGDGFAVSGSFAAVGRKNN